MRFRGLRSRGAPLLLALTLLVPVAPAQPAAAQDRTLTVAVDGSDSAPGTVAAPLRTIQRAVDLAAPGTVIQIRGGTYEPSVNIRIQKSGTPSQPITMRAYDGEHVVIDGENMPNTPAPFGEPYPRIERGAIHVSGDWWRFEGLEIINGPYGIFAIESSNNVYRDLVTRDNYETGLHLVLDSSDNRVVNLDSYGNRDPRKNGESADGLAIKQGTGSGNAVIGARLWNNADDGFDSWDFLSPIRIEDSVAWGNGVDRWGFPGWEGDGNGFKLGRGAANHVVRNSIAFDNAVGGFIDNGNPGSLRLENNTAWANGGSGFVFNRSASTLNRNLSVADGAGVNLGSSGGAGNSWDLKDDWSDADLVSTSAAVIKGPRAADGSIPATEFVRPRDHANLGADFSDDNGVGEPAPRRHEAEHAPAACDGTVDADHPGYSGGGFCNTDNVTGAAARFTVRADTPATVTLVVGYANGGPSGRPAEVVVNGSTAASAPFAATGAWSSWARATITVRLDSGDNTVRLVATGSDGLPNIDYLELPPGGA
ncbi:MULTISPECIES: right-handed parallel beta-helix repeat-containing protein [unclassified Nocardiopsis]|uniref:right-handed parallel beta-helix repeat-containing protein n=1 Tax=unclassified Nocardiopsis TaxID=2649073 RepID=UPI00135C4D3A|nr:MULTISPECIES: right-handed parallel beta-helix repeat-containing protein [unclassified Nocardiopsis]